MNSSKIIIILIAILSFLASCEEENLSQDGLIDNEEMELMEACSDNLFTSKSEVEEHLIGTWNLIGYGNSADADRPHPSIHLTINETDLTIDYSDEDEEWTETVSWEIEETSTPAGQFFSLKTTPVQYMVKIQHFCKNYMYGIIASVRVDQELMFLYEKVE